MIRFDVGPLAVLNREQQFQRYIEQNRSREIRQKRQIRMAFRALEGQIVHWPHDYKQVRGR